MDRLSELMLQNEIKVRKEKAKEKNQDESNKRLKNLTTKKMTTIMIGALDAVEKTLGWLWTNEDDTPLTENQLLLKEMYNDLRSQILYIGNNQIRSMQSELDRYTVEWNKFQMTLQVKPKEEKKDE